MIGRTNAGGGGGGTTVVTFKAAPGSTIAWSGPQSGSATLATSATTASVQLKRGTYTFTNTLSVNGSTRTIYTKTTVVGKDAATINLYPDGAVFWYGLAVVSDIAKASYGTFTRYTTAVSSTYTRTQDYSQYTMTKTTTAYKTTGKTTMHVIYRDDGSSTSVITTRFGAQTAAVGSTASSSAAFGYGNSSGVNELVVSLGSLAGQSLYFFSAFNTYSNYSGTGKCAHTIFAVYFE